MTEFVPFDLNVHLEEFRQLCIETYTWHKEQLWENYQVDLDPIVGTIPEFVEGRFESWISLKPPDGVQYILEVDGEVAGMGAITKINDDTGQITRMYTRPQYRRRGYARQILNRLLEAGRELGCIKFWLRTPKFSVAPNLYRSVGFKEREYPESMRMNPLLQPYWHFMEKKE